MSTTTISPLRQRMIEDMTARKFGPHSQRSHIESCERKRLVTTAADVPCGSRGGG
jgi:hypothetical protein